MKWSLRILCPFLVASLLVLAQAPRGAGTLPATLTDQEFWRMIEDFSEPGGTFRYENFISNERSIQYVIPELKARFKPGNCPAIWKAKPPELPNCCQCSLPRSSS